MSGRLLARNTFLNLLGQAAPMVAAVAAIPILIGAAGTERFAVLTLAWIAIGYFSLFDMGLSRALTLVTAERLGRGAISELPDLIRTALALMSGMGVVGGTLLALVSPWLVSTVLEIPPELWGEARNAFWLISLTLPAVISTGGLRGVLEAYGRFDLVNAIRIPSGLFSYMGPLLVLPFTRSLTAIVGVLVLGRLATWTAHRLCCVRAVPEMRSAGRIRPTLVAPLLRVGGWMTVSNVVSPMMTHMDRFVIGALLPVAAVAYYVTPYELATKLWILPAALTGVVFPALSASMGRDRAETVSLFDSGVRWVVLIVFPVVFVMSAFAPEGLTLWLGAEFAANGSAVFRWLAAGLLINSVGQVAGCAVQVAGRADLPAKLHCMEFPCYLAVLLLLIHVFGLQGAAMAWTLRMAVDTLILVALGDGLLANRRPVSRRTVQLLVPAAAALAMVAVPESLMVRSVVVATLLPVLAGAAWQWVLRPPERARVVAITRGRRASAPVV